ncbi:MAG TPA: hypothetical protein VLI05_05955 [Candidatus Saccharimonadia bacterium]|nr:hypothetical protein [Candidatus Saccharimonadia bacterium]
MSHTYFHAPSSVITQVHDHLQRTQRSGQVARDMHPAGSMLLGFTEDAESRIRQAFNELGLDCDTQSLESADVKGGLFPKPCPWCEPSSSSTDS